MRKLFGNVVIHRPAAVTSIAPPLCRQGIIAYKDGGHPCHGQLGATHAAVSQQSVAAKEFAQLLFGFLLQLFLGRIFQ